MAIQKAGKAASGITAAKRKLGAAENTLVLSRPDDAAKGGKLFSTPKYNPANVTHFIGVSQ